MAGAVFSGAYFAGIVLNSPATQNPATVASQSYVTNTGTTYNGDAIYGATGTAWTLTNYGSITAQPTAGAGIYFADGGNVTNGSAGAGTAVISSTENGVVIENAAGTVTNFGVIALTAGGTNGSGVYLGAGGTVTNGSTAATQALIESYYNGVAAKNVAATVINFGTIESLAITSGVGVYLGAGGSIINEAGGLITGEITAISAENVAATVSNFGTITSATDFEDAAIYLGAGGSVANGSAAATQALISGADGVSIANAAGTVVNFGTIVGAGLIVGNARSVVDGEGVSLATGGTVQNGSGGSTAATIDGYYIGVVVGNGGRGTVTNFGTIESTQINALSPLGEGLLFQDGGTIVNSGLVTSYQGDISTNVGMPLSLTNSGIIESTGTAGSFAAIYSGGTGTIINAGTIESAGSNVTAVDLGGGGNITNSGVITSYQSDVSTKAETSLLLINSGTIESTGAAGSFAAVYAGGGGTIINGGTIDSAGGSVTTVHLDGGGTVRNSGSILSQGALTPAVYIDNGAGLVINSETIENAAAGPGVQIATGTVVNQLGGLIEGGSDAVLVDTGIGVVTNLGTIQSTASAANDIGVYLGAGGTVTNQSGGLIAGYTNAVAIMGAAGIVTNLGEIQSNATIGAAVYLAAGGHVTNGAIGSSSASIVGARAGVILANRPGTVSNFGTIESTSSIVAAGHLHGVGVGLEDGGSFVNGAAGALVEAYGIGVYIGGSGGVPAEGAVGTVANFGTVESTGGTAGSSAVVLVSGGTVTNRGLIESLFHSGVVLTNAAGAVINFGTIESDSAGTAGVGVYLTAGGKITNEAGGLITAYHSAILGENAAVTVANSGTLSSSRYPTIDLEHGGTVTNFGTVFSTSTTNAAIFINYGPARVTNLGTIENIDTRDGVHLAGGVVTNEAGGLIEGGSDGIRIGEPGTPPRTYIGAGTVINLGTVASATGNGVLLGDGGLVVNGNSAATHALITGGTDGIGIENVAGTVLNFGTIESAATTLGAGIYLNAGGKITNEASGLITAYRNDVATKVVAAAVVNLGTMRNTGVHDAVYLGAGGSVVNGAAGAAHALIESDYTAVAEQNAAGIVVNFGTIESTASGTSGAGVYFDAGGKITNEAGGLIIAANADAVAAKLTAATVINLGTIRNSSATNPALYLGAGGQVTNGTSGSAAASISSSAYGIVIRGGAGAVTNFGTIARGAGGTSGVALYLGLGGTINNGSAAATHALISSAFTAVAEKNVAGTITNFGTITSSGRANPGAIYLGAGGRVTNQASGLITAYLSAVTSKIAAATITNDGAIRNSGTASPAIYLGAGGTVANGAAGATSALIMSSDQGVLIGGGTGGVTNFGRIVGLAGDGVELAAGGVVTNEAGGLITGAVDGVAFLDTAGTVTNFGTIKSDATGTSGVGVYLGAGGTLTNGASGTTTALISSSVDGVVTNGAVAGTVINFGTIKGAGPLGHGVNLIAGGMVTNFGLIANASGPNDNEIQNAAVAVHGAAGTIVNYAIIRNTGSYDAIRLNEGGSVTNNKGGLISGGLDGVAVLAAAGTVTNFGTIESAATTAAAGIYLGAGGTITNEAGGLIAGYGNAVSTKNAAATFTNLGVVVSANGNGVYLGAGGSVTNGSADASPAVIRAGADGVDARNVAATVVNYGTITTPARADAAAVYLGAGGRVTNAAGGIITAYLTAVATKNAVAAITNDGAILNNGTSSPAIYLGAGGNVTNGAAGITGALIVSSDQGVFTNGGAATVTNYGTIEASGFAVYLDHGGESGGVVSNRGLIATMSATSSAIFINYGVGRVTNFGTIENIVASSGVQLAEGIVANEAGGLIEGRADGVFVAPGTGQTYVGAGTVTNNGTIRGLSGDAVYMQAGGVVANGAGGLVAGAVDGIAFLDIAGTVVNLGTIESTASGTSGVGVYLNAGGKITNDAGGLITARGDAVVVDNAAATVVNLGTIESTAGTSSGIALDTVGEVQNRGLIGGYFGVYIGSGSVATNASVTVVNDATITGVTGVDISALDTGASTIVNAGTITGTGGTAVMLGSGHDRLVITPSARFVGRVQGGGARSILELAAGSGAGVLSGLGIEFIDFGALTVDSGARWTVDALGGALNGMTLTGNNTASTLASLSTGLLFLSSVSDFNTIDLAAGGNSVTVTDTTLSGGAVTINAGSSGDNVIDASGDSAASAGKSLTYVAKSGSDTFIGGYENDTVEVTVAAVGGDRLAGGSGTNTLAIIGSGAPSLGGVSGFETIVLPDTGHVALTLTNANFAGVASHTITVDANSAGDTVNASAVTGSNTVIVTDGDAASAGGIARTSAVMSSDAVVAAGGSGTDTIIGGQGNNIYAFAGAANATLGIDNAYAGGTAPHGELTFGANIAQSDLWFAESGSNLVAEVIGTAERVTVDGWFGANPSAQLREIVSGNGLELDSQVSQLVAAMASYSSSHPSFNPTAGGATMPDDASLQHALASAWHSGT